MIGRSAEQMHGILEMLMAAARADARLDRGRSELTQTLARIAAGDRVTWLSMPWHALAYEHTIALRALLAEAYTPGGANLRLTHLRGVLRACLNLRWIDTDTFHASVGDLPRIRGTGKRRGRYVSRAELRASRRSRVGR